MDYPKYYMDGKESFTDHGEPIGYTMLDFWRYQYSNRFDLHDELAEFLVAKALGIEFAQNKQYWTLFDIEYRNCRIEVKETSYYHSFASCIGHISKQRVFSIRKANSVYENSNEPNQFVRQNDIYVFCLNIGEDEISSDPLKLDHWEFYIVPTRVINEQCEDQKTISLSRIKSMGFEAKMFTEIRAEIDRIIEEQGEASQEEI